MLSSTSIDLQRYEAISRLIDQFMFEMGFVIPVEGFMSQDLSIIETSLRSIYTQQQMLETQNDALSEELGSCEELVKALEEELKTMRNPEE